MLPLLLVASMASWQRLAAQSHAVQPDSVLLSERVDGDYQLKSYRVQQPAEADFSLHYRIGNATLSPTLGENGEELDDLKKLAATLDDTLHHAQQVVVVGYASPDGPLSLNERLAKARAENFAAYLKKNAPHLAAAKVVCRSEVSPWTALREAVEKSDMADKAYVLEVLSGDHSPLEVERALKSHPEAWNYLAHNLLPPLRRVTVEVDYAQGKVVETRTRIPKPQPAPAPTPTPTPAPKSVAVTQKTTPTDPCCVELLVRETVGIIVAMPGEIDY